MVVFGSQYYTLVAELRELSPDAAFDPATREKIVHELSASDKRTVGLMEQWDEIARTEDVAEQHQRFEEYYRRTEKEGGFLRAWARFDKQLRENIARGEWPQGLEKTSNIVEREKALDKIRWEKADELQGFDSFGAPTVLAYLVKLGIVGRWANLDAATGREMYDKLVNGLRE